MRVAFALFADAANLSQEGKLNVLGVYDALQVAALPAVHPRANLVVHMKGSGADVGAHTVSFRWLSPSGQELWRSQPTRAHFPGRPKVPSRGTWIDDATSQSIGRCASSP